MTYGINYNYGSTKGDSNATKESQDKPQEYPQHGQYTANDQGYLSGGDNVPDAPPLPQDDGGSGGQTKVSTEALRKYADNLDAIADELLGIGTPTGGTGAFGKLSDMPDLQAGAFKEANDLTHQVTGVKPKSDSGSGSGDTKPSSDSKSSSDSASGSDSTSGSGGSGGTLIARGGLRGHYLQALHDLRKTLKDTAENVRTMAGKYASIADINQKAASELRGVIGDLDKDVAQVKKDPL